VLADSARPGGTTWVEPAYKMLWSTKALLPVLWQLFGTDPVLSRYLLPAYFADEAPTSWRSYVRKPLWGREGANVAIVADGEVLAERIFSPRPFARFAGFRGMTGTHHSTAARQAHRIANRDKVPFVGAAAIKINDKTMS
jgi:hypothetical protein